MMKNVRVTSVVMKKISMDLSGQKIIYSGDKFTIIDHSTDDLLIEINNDCNLIYSWKVFGSYSLLFSLSIREFAKILKIWVETTFSIKINQVMRINTDLKYLIRNRIKEKKEVDLKKRFGFSYQAIKKMSCLDKDENGFYILN